PVQGKQLALLDGRTGLLAAPFAPRAVVEAGVRLPDQGESETENSRGHARAAGCNDGFHRVDPSVGEDPLQLGGRLEGAIRIEQARKRNVPRAGDVAATQAGTRLRLRARKPSRASGIGDLRRTALDHAFHILK